jgi:hypothetical protein
MAKDFRLVTQRDTLSTVSITKDSTTVLRPGTFITLDGSALAIEAVAGSTALAYTIAGAAAGETTVDVVIDHDIVFEGTADAVFADTMKGTEVDLVVNSSVQNIDVGASTTDVFKVDISTSAGTVGSAANVRVKINKPLF